MILIRLYLLGVSSYLSLIFLSETKLNPLLRPQQYNFLL